MPNYNYRTRNENTQQKRTKIRLNHLDTDLVKWFKEKLFDLSTHITNRDKRRNWIERLKYELRK